MRGIGKATSFHTSYFFSMAMILSESRRQHVLCSGILILAHSHMFCSHGECDMIGSNIQLLVAAYLFPAIIATNKTNLYASRIVENCVYMVYFRIKLSQRNVNWM